MAARDYAMPPPMSADRKSGGRTGAMRVSPLRRRTLAHYLSRVWRFWSLWRLGPHMEFSPVGECNTLNQFWSCFGALPVTDMPQTVSQFLFQDGLTVAEGTKTSSLAVLIPSIDSGSRVWQRLCLCLVADLLPYASYLTGISVHIVGKAVWLRVWLSARLPAEALDTVAQAVAQAAHQSAVFNYNIALEPPPEVSFLKGEFTGSANMTAMLHQQQQAEDEAYASQMFQHGSEYLGGQQQLSPYQQRLQMQQQHLHQHQLYPGQLQQQHSSGSGSGSSYDLSMLQAAAAAYGQSSQSLQPTVILGPQQQQQLLQIQMLQASIEKQQQLSLAQQAAAAAAVAAVTAPSANVNVGPTLPTATPIPTNPTANPVTSEEIIDESQFPLSAAAANFFPSALFPPKSRTPSPPASTKSSPSGSPPLPATASPPSPVSGLSGGLPAIAI